MVKKKQKELKGMPEKDKVYQDGEAVIHAWESCQDAAYNLKVAKEALKVSMKVHKRFSVVVTDTSGVNRKLGYEEKEGITISKVRDKEQVK